MERETGIEPATNSLEGCDSTIELLPRASFILAGSRRARLFEAVNMEGEEHRCECRWNAKS